MALQLLARPSYPGGFGYGRIEFGAEVWDVTSPKGPRDPIVTSAGTTSTDHNGTDFWRNNIAGVPAINWGDDATCVAAGPAWNGYGNAVFLRCDSGYQLLFAHLQAGLHVPVGSRVPRGGVVGQVGTTGASTGPHLHFGVIQQGLPTVNDVNAYVAPSLWLNPMDYFVESLDVPVVEEAPLTGTLPRAGSMSLMVTAYQCTPVEIETWLAADPTAPERALYMLVDGVWRQYIFGAPTQVNASFPDPVPAGMAVLVAA